VPRALPALHEIARILVVAGPARGDVLLATPLIASLRRAGPDAAIDVLVYRGQADILEGNPDVSEILSASKHPGFRESLRLLRRLLRHYDLAISTKHTDRAIWYTFIAGSSRIAVVPPARDAWKRWITRAHVAYDHDATHTIAQNGALAALLGIEASAEVRLPTAADAASVVTGLLPAGVATKPLAVLHPNPGLPHKRWTLSGWAAVARYLDRRGFCIVLTGSDADAAYLQSAMAWMPVTPVNLAGRLRFADITELLYRCAIYVGADTVTSHMAAAAGVPTVALFGPETPRVWGPWPAGFRSSTTPFPGTGDQHVGNVLVVQESTPCPTCRQGYCLRRSERGRACILMQNLGSEQVVDGVSRMLEPVEVCALPGVMSRPGTDSAAFPPP
jgi:heptosyltransferase-3